jgi:hypothetical protein
MMGHIRLFDVVDIADRRGIKTFVETGTGQGDSIASVLDCFDDLLSCELYDELAHKATSRFAYCPKVRIFFDASDVFMTDVCRILPHRQPVMFWLDAHFPGADYGLAAYHAEQEIDVRLPLPWELKAIAEHRPYHNDVILIDDARIFIDGPFQHGNLPEHLRPLCPKERNIDFITELFNDTHHIQIFFEHEGYIKLMPKYVS